MRPDCEPVLCFPLWLEHSGLPALLSEEGKSPLGWLLFRRLVEEDLAANPGAPGPFEMSIDRLAALCGAKPDKARAALKKLRKAGAVRCFLPDNDEEEALFEIAAPLDAPKPMEEVRRADPRLAALDDGALRYAAGAAGASKPKEASDALLREVVDLYLSTVSMRLNNFVADELRLIASRYDLPLVRKVFARAREKEVQSLGWILREIREEDRRKAARDARRKEAAEAASAAYGRKDR